MSVCAHPKSMRSLLHGYDIMCDGCQQIIGRAALFPCAILDAKEAQAMLDHPAGSSKAHLDVRAKLREATA